MTLARLRARQLCNRMLQLYQQGDFRGATAVAAELCGWIEQKGGRDHEDYASCLQNAAAVYSAASQHSAAEPLLERALEMRRRLGREGTQGFAVSLANLAALYYSTGRYSEAEPLFREAVETLRDQVGEQHPDYASVVCNLAEVCTAMGRHAEAEPLFREVLGIYRDQIGERHPKYAVALSNLGQLLRVTGRLTEAEPLLSQALEIRRAVLGEGHPDYVKGLNRLAELYHSMGRLSEAAELSRRAVEITRDHFGDTDPSLANSLNNLGEIQKGMGDYASAEENLKRALEIRRVTLGERHPYVATSLNNLALLYDAAGNYRAAEPLYRRAYEALAAAVGDEHPNVAVFLNNLALVYEHLGDYRNAERHFRQALEVVRKAFGRNHPLYAKFLDNLGALYAGLGDYESARGHIEEALEIGRRTLGPKHADLASGLNNLAAVHKALADDALAALPDRHRTPPSADTLRIVLEHYRQAEQLHREALDVVRAGRGARHPDYARCLANLGVLQASIGNHAEAEASLRQAIEIHREALGERHPHLAGSLHNLASLYMSLDDYSSAEPLLQSALEIYRAALGEHHPDVAKALRSLACVYAATSRPEEALRVAEDATAIDDHTIGHVVAMGSESQRAAFLKTTRSIFFGFLSLVYAHFSSSAEVVLKALDLVLRRKAIEAEVLAAQRDAVLQGSYPELREKLHRLTLLRMQIAQKALAGPGQEGLRAHQAALAQWGSEKESLERELVQQIPELDIDEKIRAADRQAVAGALPPGTVLVEFVRFNVYDFTARAGRGEPRWKPARYLAFVLQAGQPDSAKMIDIGEAEEIDHLIAALRSAITGEPHGLGGRDLGAEQKTAGPEDTEVGGRLKELLLEPLLAGVGDAKRILLAPDGDLTRLPFEVLQGSEGRHLIDERSISYVSSGRDVLRFGLPPARQATEPLVLADPDFDLGTAAEPRGRPAERRPSRRSRDLPRDTMHFVRLPGTRAEGEHIADKLGVEPYLGPATLESRLKACRSPRILHIATHGFFLQNQLDASAVGVRDLGDAPSLSGDLADRIAESQLENPLLRAGLALAGANTWLRNQPVPQEAEDGILTAEDVSGLDLICTELVVLSACETGLGEIRTGEGVFGLRRAFVLAGADSLVMSLWKVPDLATAVLMARFYENLIARKLPRNESLREAQLYTRDVTIRELEGTWLREESATRWLGHDARSELVELAQSPSDRRPFQAPAYWGAFILQGDPDPLHG